MSSPLRMLFIAISAVNGNKQRERRERLKGAKVRSRLTGEHQERAETFSYYSGDTPENGAGNGDT